MSSIARQASFINYCSLLRFLNNNHSLSNTNCCLVSLLSHYKAEVVHMKCGNEGAAMRTNPPEVFCKKTNGGWERNCWPLAGRGAKGYPFRKFWEYGGRGGKCIFPPRTFSAEIFCVKNFCPWPGRPTQHKEKQDARCASPAKPAELLNARIGEEGWHENMNW